MNLRKGCKTTPAIKRSVRFRHDTYQRASEIGATLMLDKYRLSVDRVLCDPSKRSEFDMIVAGVDPYRIRKLALALRKARRLTPRTGSAIGRLGTQDHFANIPVVLSVYLLCDRTG